MFGVCSCWAIEATLRIPAAPHPIGLMNPTHDPLPYKLSKEREAVGLGPRNRVITPISRVILTPSYLMMVCIQSRY